MSLDGLLVLAIAPLERLGGRLASGLVDEPVDEQAYERFRKLQIYRATYEAVPADEDLGEQDRQALESMADNLGLFDEERGFVEEQVARERSERGEAAPVAAAG